MNTDADPAGRGRTGPARGRQALIAAAAIVAAVIGDAASGAGSEVHDIERYLNIKAAGAPTLSPDAGTVAFLTNITGSNQIWRVPAGGGWPDPITFFTDRVTSPAWSPRGDWIAFSKDAGGDENFQIHLASPDGSRLVALTGDPAVRHNFESWSRDGRFIAYSSNERDRRFFDVYVMDVDARRARRVVEKDALFSAGPFSPDGRRLIVSRANASLDNDLFVVDLTVEEGPAEPVLLTPHEGIAEHSPVGWTAGGSGIFVVGDPGREFAALGRLDLASKEITWIREPRWDVESAAITEDGRTLAFVVNEDGYDALALMDAATSRDLPAPEVPRGQVGSLRFSRDGRTLAMTLNGATRTGDVWLADLASRTLRQVTRSSTAGIPASSFVEPQLVRHRSFDGLEIPSFLYLPTGASKSGPVPCIVAPHGGPEGQTVAGFSGVRQYYVNHGYAVWAPNVRGSTGYGKTFTHLDDVRKREDSVKDLIAGVEWLRASGDVDPKRIAVVGGSYGGYMTLAAVTLYPDLWAAAVDSFGIANFRTFLGKTAAYRAGLRATEYGDPIADAEFLDAVSPIHKADRIRAPLLVLQGANDPRVPAHESEQIVEAVRKRGGVAEYILFPDEGHGWTKLANQITAYRATVEFLDRHLKPAAAAGSGEGR
jgi:dipeptidyl aminopeptidase/acylaminoacyl peptidase